MRRWLLTGLMLAAVAPACSGRGAQLAQVQSTQPTTTSTAAPATTAPAAAATDVTVTTVATTVSTAPGTEPIPTSKLRGPKTAELTAQLLVRVERGLRGANRDPQHLETLGRKQQLAYRALAAHPAWVDGVMADVPDDLRDAVQFNIDAGNALGSLTGEAPPSGFPDWQILTPEPAATLRAYYDEAEQTHGIPWQYLAAIHFVETRMGRIRGLSTAGAQGPMQFIPDTWAAYGSGDINSNRDAILAAGSYLQANNAATDIDTALFRYNNDERYVEAIKAYARVMLADSSAYDGYYYWQVFYASAEGTFLLPEGWSKI